MLQQKIFISEQDCEQLTLFPADSLASPFPWLESKKVKGTTVTYGRKCSELSPKLNRLGYLVRTYLESSKLPAEQFVRTWSVRDTLSPYLILKLRLSVPRTEETGYSLWPTPRAQSANGSGPSRIGHKADLQTVVGGPLNPEWVEWLMGFPIGWTELSA